MSGSLVMGVLLVDAVGRAAAVPAIGFFFLANENFCLGAKLSLAAASFSLMDLSCFYYLSLILTSEMRHNAPRSMTFDHMLGDSWRHP